jgi:hypothetical protein
LLVHYVGEKGRVRSGSCVRASVSVRVKVRVSVRVSVRVKVGVL